MIEEVVRLIVDCIKGGNKVLTFGVGGNASSAMHFAAELSGKFEQYEDPLPCICLCDNPCVLTAITNDFGWEEVFSRQIKALAKPGDVVIAFSVSTGGRYLYEAFYTALHICSAILICGRDTHEIFYEGVRLPNYLVLELSSLDTPYVQEEQLRLIHQICKGVKEALCQPIMSSGQILM